MASKNKSLTLKEKYNAIQEVKKGIKSKCSIAKDLGIAQSTLTNFSRKQDLI